MDDGSREAALLAATARRIRKISEEQHELTRQASAGVGAGATAVGLT